MLPKIPSSTWLQVLFTLLIPTAYAHSWVEQLMVIGPNGTFVGAPGYPRGNVLRTSPGFGDPTMTYLIPPNGREIGSVILPTDRLCKPTQQTRNQTQGSPRLQASPGAAIALRFQENGHVTLPWNQPGKPANRGTVYVYGTTEPTNNETLLAVHKVWNRDGTGGDKRGVLLSVQNFDDGRCYQINNGNISEARQSEFPHVADKLMGADLWCQQDIALPSNISVGKPYTLYWVWDWPTLPHIDPTLPNGKPEIYTTCIDVDVIDNKNTSDTLSTGYVNDQSLNNAAIPSQFAGLYSSGGSKGPAASSTASPTVTSPTPTTTTSFFQSTQQPGLLTITVTETAYVTPSSCSLAPQHTYGPPRDPDLGLSRRHRRPQRVPPRVGIKRHYPVQH